MSREYIYDAIILKKTPFGEADEIVTAYSKQAGKLKFLSKASKLSRSKLGQALQGLFLLNVRLTGGSGRGLPKIISAEIKKTFSVLRENLDTTTAAIYANELVTKFSPDGEQNADLFILLENMLENLNQPLSEHQVQIMLAKFKIDFLFLLGLGIKSEPRLELLDKVAFSNHLGGFGKAGISLDERIIDTSVFKQFLALKAYEETKSKDNFIFERLLELQVLLTDFLEYNLERRIHSEKLISF